VRDGKSSCEADPPKPPKLLGKASNDPMRTHAFLAAMHVPIRNSPMHVEAI
jgi:hypothetical protein